MLNSKQPLEKVLNSDKINEEQKQKIRLVQEARLFAFNKLKLAPSESYSEYVALNRPYVTYAVTASYKWKFETYLWNFPIIGKAPYKGFYNETLANEEVSNMKKEDFDVSLRGVSAYSTLGKLNDPLLSSMLHYSSHNLVNTIIHELTHATLFIKDNIDFNERLAVFVANKGTELFYLEKEGTQSKTLEKIKNENVDDALFSKFITDEVHELSQWYANSAPSRSLPTEEREMLRQERLALIKIHFEKNIKPKLKTNTYDRLFNKKFNNADLSVYITYMKSLDVFEIVYKQAGSNISDFLNKCKLLNDVSDPEAELLKWANLKE